MIPKSMLPIRDQSFSTYTKFSEKLAFLTPDTDTDLSENFAYEPNE